MPDIEIAAALGLDEHGSFPAWLDRRAIKSRYRTIVAQSRGTNILLGGPSEGRVWEVRRLAFMKGTFFTSGGESYRIGIGTSPDSGPASETASASFVQANSVQFFSRAQLVVPGGYIVYLVLGPGALTPPYTANLGLVEFDAATYDARY